MPKYSIVVPVYNMSHYLGSFIESLRKQTYKEFEVILVDDCSTDDSFRICFSTQQLDRRFLVVKQQKNSGLSSTRNMGMENSIGDYIMFADPDDYVENNWIECVDKVVRSKDYDLITWGMYNNILYPDNREEVSLNHLNYYHRKEVHLPTNNDWLTLFMDTFYASSCNKIYRRSIIQSKGLSFDLACPDFEDYIFNATYCQFVQSFCIMNEALYHYRQPINQIATLKRKWDKVSPFDVSRKVYCATEQFIKSATSNWDELNKLMLYVYKAYFNEIEYAYRKKTWHEFRISVGILVNDESFKNVLISLNQPPIQKVILPLLFMIKLKTRFLLAAFLWLLAKKNCWD